jgi:hypothetical protein
MKEKYTSFDPTLLHLDKRKFKQAQEGKQFVNRHSIT